MNLLRYDQYRINEGFSWEDEEILLPCLTGEEQPDFFPCLHLVTSGDKDHLNCWNKKGEMVLDFPIARSSYEIATDNPGNLQMLKMNPWSTWMRNEANRENLLDLKEILDDTEEEDDFNPTDEVLLFLDLCGLNSLKTNSHQKLENGIHLIGLDNGMEAEVDYDEENRLMKKLDIFSAPNEKYPAISICIKPKLKWGFRIDDMNYEINDVKKISDRQNLISSLITAALGKTQDDESIGNIRSYYEEQLASLKKLVNLPNFHRSNLDQKDEEIYRFKNLVSKYIGEKTADELYKKAKSEIYQHYK